MGWVLSFKIFIPSFVKRRIIAGTSIVSVVFMSFVGGAAVIYFNLATSESLRAAFMGYEAWTEHGAKNKFTKSSGETQPGINRDEASKTFDGFTLYTTTQGTTAELIDMHGNVVHQWNKPFGEVWPRPKHVKHPVAEEQIHWFRSRALPEGDLLAIYQTDNDTPHGYGMVKLDRYSNVIWALSDNVHHDFDVAENGRIYALSQQIGWEKLPGLDMIVPPYLEDTLVILSPDGQELDKISILNALIESPYREILSSIKAIGINKENQRSSHFSNGETHHSATNAVADGQMAEGLPAVLERGDVLHANSVKILTRELARKFPFLKEGQVLLSLCRINTIAVLDVNSRKITWAARGIWSMQHDAEFLDNGHILLYDNLGMPLRTRVIEFDPVNLSYPWSSANSEMKPFVAGHRGMKQRLSNGNLLIVDPEGDRLIELDQTNSPVWEYVCPTNGNTSANEYITGAQRYTHAELKFLEGVLPRQR